MLKLYGYLKWASHLNINIVDVKISYANDNKEYTMAIKHAKHNFNESFINDSANKYKAAWQVINSACNTSNSKGNLNFDVDAINNFFINHVNHISETLNHCNNTCMEYLRSTTFNSDSCFYWKSVTQEEVLKIVLDLKNSKSRDIYDINSEFIKHIIYLISNL